MKRNRLFILGIVTVLVALLSLTLVSGTFAKYTSTATGSDTAKVAKWSVEVNDHQIANNDPQTVDFNLFEVAKVYDTNGVTDFTAAGTDDADVKNGSEDALIAPGTWGKCAVVIENLSEVTAKATVTFAQTNGSNVPMEYSLDGSAWTSNIGTLSVTTADLAIESGSETVNLWWRWVFEGGTDALDTADTALGIAAQTTAPSVVVTATIVAEQVD